MKVRKPMRLEGELIDLVEKYGEGKSFTAKMEYVLNDYFNTLDGRKKELKMIEKSIKDKEKEYQEFEDKLNEARNKFEDCLRDILYS